jgi:hypothetical protein
MSSTTRFFGSEPLKKLELNITHGRKEFPVILGSSFLPEKERLRPLRAGCFPNDVFGKRLERHFDLVQRFAVEVALHNREILGARSLSFVSSSSWFRLRGIGRRRRSLAPIVD